MSAITTIETRAGAGQAQGSVVRTLDRLAGAAASVAGVWARDVVPGDWVIVRTRNSVYALAALGGGDYRVEGGWFLAPGRSDEPVKVSGCTWGGSALHTGLVAAPGMFLEFANGVRTTRIQEVRILRGTDGRVH